MNTENVSGDQKRNRKHKLLPLLALVVGLGLPAYAYAASEEECQYCHNYCTSSFQGALSYCQAILMSCPGPYYECQEPYDACMANASAEYAACHNYCDRPGGPCSE